MKRVVTIHAAKANLSKLIEEVEAGGEIFIARGETPVVKLVLVDPPKLRRRFGAMKGKAATTRAFFEPLPFDELSAWDVKYGRSRRRRLRAPLW